MSSEASTGAVSQILFRTPIAAVNHENHLRVYTEDVFGNIRESLYESGWKNGTINNVIAQGKVGGPIAATSKALNEIRVYYVSSDNKLREIAYSANKGWYHGDLNAKNYSVAPYSKIAATFLPGNGQVLRVYVQKEDNTIQEYGYDSPSSGWRQETNIGLALPGSSIAATSYHTNQLSIRVYYQALDLKVIEKAYDASTSWYTGGLTFAAAPRASLSVVSFNASNSGISLRVYYSAVAGGNKLLEKAWDGKWYDGGFSQDTIAGTDTAAISWGNVEIRVYFQKGNAVTGVTEWAWGSGGWYEGNKAIPPA